MTALDERDAVFDPGEEVCAPTQILQDLVLDAAADRRALYWHFRSPSGELADPPEHPIAYPGSTLGFDTFANSFYERYWRDLASLETLGFEIETSGPCIISIVRRRAGASETLLLTSRADGTHRRSVLSTRSGLRSRRWARWN